MGLALSVNVPTVYSWFHCWKAQGLKGLEHKPYSGRPPVADDGYLQVIEATISQRNRWFEFLCYRPILDKYFIEDPNFIIYSRSRWFREGRWERFV